MTIAETTRLEPPTLPGKPGEPARQIDLRKPPTGADLPEVNVFFADFAPAIGPDAMDQLRRSLPDGLRWAERIENARAAGDEARAQVPTTKQILAWVDKARGVDMGDPEAVYNVPFGLEFRACWNAFRYARGLTNHQLRDSHGIEAIDTFALRMAEYSHKSLTVWLALREAQRAQKAERAGAVEKARAELLAARFKDAPAQLERLADALSAAGRTSEAGEVRRVGLGVLRRLIEADTFNRLVRD